MRQKIAAGNWKMNGSQDALAEIAALADALPPTPPGVVICPPAHLLIPAVRTAGRGQIAIGAQDCHPADSGAHTGDISAAMIAGTGAAFVILGHSERRTAHGETDADVRAKTASALRAGLTAIVCLGESDAERSARRTLDVIGAQLDGSLPDDIVPDRLVIAYEPIWAIGTGKVPTLDQIAEVHADLRARLADRYGEKTAHTLPLLYGGSVKAGNAAEIFAVAHVDGALVGGASLKVRDFAPIVTALSQA